MRRSGLGSDLKCFGTGGRCLRAAPSRCRPVPVWAVAVVVVLALAAGGLGCANTPVAAGGGNVDIPLPSPPPPQPPPPLVTISPDHVPPTVLKPVWSLEADRPVTAAMAGDGSWVVVGRSHISSGIEVWSALLYNAQGKQVWSKTYREDRYRTIQVASLGNGKYFSVALYTYSNPGIVYLYNAQGQRLWSRHVRSSVSLELDLQSSVLYGIDHGNRELFSATIPSGPTRNLRNVTEHSSFEVGGGRILICDKSAVVLCQANGTVLQRQGMPEDFTAVSLAPDGGALYAATRGADSSVMRIDEGGNLVWSTRIPAAGSNSLTVSPTGEHVMAYNITLDSGFVVLDASDGSILCRNTFAPVEEKASQFIRWARLLPEQDAILVDYAVARSRPSGHVEEHSLLLFSITGELLARFEVGDNVDVLVSDDGRACVAVSTVAFDWTGPRPNAVRFYDLTPMFGPQRP